MPSDERLTRAVDALRGPLDAYRDAVTATGAQMREYLDAHRVPTAGRAELAAQALGRFAGGRLDASRFAAAFEGGRTTAPEDMDRIERCVDTLDDLAAAGDRLFVHDLPAGSDLESAIGDAFAGAGRAFGAALAFQAIRAGTYREEVHAPSLAAFPFTRWNRAERLAAPPMVLLVDGGDVDAARIAPYVDGHVRIVLVVRGEMAPAALASLITPGTFVMQTGDAADVARATRAPGAAIVAIAGESAARFVHDSAAGRRLVERLQVQAMSTAKPQRAIGRYQPSQLVQQLAQLDALRAAAAAEGRVSATEAIQATTAVAAAAATGSDAVETLAGWLMGQAGFAEAATS